MYRIAVVCVPLHLTVSDLSYAIALKGVVWKSSEFLAVLEVRVVVLHVFWCRSTALKPKSLIA